MISEQHVLLNDLIGFWIVTKVKEEGLEKTATFFIDLPKLGVVVPDKSVSVSDGGSHDICVCDVLVVGYIGWKSEVENEWLLGCSGVLIVVSCKRK